MIALFKNLADQARSSVAAFHNDFEALCDYYAFTGDYFSASMIYDKLREQMDQLLIPDQETASIKRKSLQDLMAALVYESILSDLDNTEYLSLLKIITSKEPRYRPLTDTAVWIEAIAHAKDFALIYPDYHNVRQEKLRESFAREFDIAAAAHCLRALGCTVTIKETELEFSSGITEVVQAVENCIVAFGPVEFIRTVIGHMIANNMYIPEYKRYLVRNEISFLSFQAMPMVPFGFLLNLAVKHIGKPEAKIPRAKSDALLEEINYKSKLLGTIADARAYGIWELHFQNEDTLLDTIRSIGLYDAIFSFPSADIDEILAYMEHLFNWQDNALFRARYGFSKDEVIQVTRTIALIAPDNGPCIVYLSSLRKILNHISSEIITVILTQLSHQPDAINNEYELTEHYDRINFGQKPLIQLGPTKFLLCDKSWCAIAFYETLATMVRNFDSKKNESNIQIGYALEEFVRLRFKEKGITYHQGNYADSGAAKGEADGIIETEKALVLLEIKKKVLTRRSKTGATVSLVIDLAGSLLEAQVQAGRTEILLRQQGYITLESQTLLSKIPFNDREIERITLSQWDFGSFQDRVIVNNILTILVNHEYILLKEDNKSDVEAFKKMKKLRKEHETQAAKLHELDPRFDHYPYFSAWFLSVPQLLTVLKYANNNEEFYEVLRSTKSVTMNSMNFYFEFLYSYIRSPKRTDTSI